MPLRSEQHPFVSVVIPVFNDAEHLRAVLEALTRQSCGAEAFQVIVVDNGSTDGSVELARSFPAITVLAETTHIGSPYSARNRGIENTKAEVIALLDATCVPERTWLEAGLKCLDVQDADLVGGHVTFRYGDPPSAAEILDALTNIKMKESIQQRGVAKTANLFVRRSVFDAIGLFPEGIRSGGDVQWTRAATRHGFRLVFCEAAAVSKPARPLLLLVKKQWRVAKAQPDIWAASGKPVGAARALARAVRPPARSFLRQAIRDRGEPFMEDRVLQVWAVHYLIKIIMGIGNAYAILTGSAGHTRN